MVQGSRFHSMLILGLHSMSEGVMLYAEMLVPAVEPLLVWDIQ